MSGYLDVLHTGPLCTVQDLGRPGHAAIGVGCAGAADQGSYALANRLVGNPEGAAALEVLLGGLRFRAGTPLVFAVTGAETDVMADIGRRRVVLGHNSRHHVDAGTTVEIGQARTGLRCYVAVRGGLDVPAVLGSRSRDTLAEIGPAPLQTGDILRTGTQVLDLPGTDLAPGEPLGEQPTLRVVRGPRDDWLDDAEALVDTRWVVSDRISRVGARLTPQQAPRLRLRDPQRQLPSEGVGLGAIQVPPGGEPVIFLADHPVTGGYPVAGVLVDEDVDRAAQLRPGSEVRLAWA
ncbi:MAG: biotin-dependent carboxyltransferase family protein [Actinomycetota bacterium]|nr:biotin-dependent carboxyltransferase family protein [Actinomycetota bacterium]